MIQLDHIFGYFQARDVHKYALQGAVPLIFETDHEVGSAGFHVANGCSTSTTLAYTSGYGCCRLVGGKVRPERLCLVQDLSYRDKQGGEAFHERG